MKFTVKSLAKLGLLPLLAILSVGSVSAQTDLGKTILEKLTAKVTKLESACAKDIKKYCSTVTPGEGRMIYCMEAHEDKISIKCAFELGEAATSVQTAADALKDAVIACKAEIKGVCEKGRARSKPNRCVSAVEQIDSFTQLRGSPPENRNHGRSVTAMPRPGSCAYRKPYPSCAPVHPAAALHRGSNSRRPPVTVDE